MIRFPASHVTGGYPYVVMDPENQMSASWVTFVTNSGVTGTKKIWSAKPLDVCTVAMLGLILAPCRESEFCFPK